jgi:aromatic ring-cleaving dioxygenase
LQLDALKIYLDRVATECIGEHDMTETSIEPQVRGYHAHVYYETATRPVAERLRERLAGQFPIELGRFSGEKVGPHPIPQFQIIFNAAQFQHVVPWLMLNREGLDVLVHPLTDDSVDDHSRHALWLGKPVALKLETLRRAYHAEQFPTR